MTQCSLKALFSSTISVSLLQTVHGYTSPHIAIDSHDYWYNVLHNLPTSVGLGVGAGVSGVKHFMYYGVQTRITIGPTSTDVVQGLKPPFDSHVCVAMLTEMEGGVLFSQPSYLPG